jgi:hypothetical protein
MSHDMYYFHLKLNFGPAVAVVIWQENNLFPPSPTAVSVGFFLESIVELVTTATGHRHILSVLHSPQRL